MSRNHLKNNIIYICIHIYIFLLLISCRSIAIYKHVVPLMSFLLPMRDVSFVTITEYDLKYPYILCILFQERVIRYYSDYVKNKLVLFIKEISIINI